MTDKQLKKKLHLHALWLQGAEGGQRANLRGANLRGANLRGADFQRADFRGAKLQGADLKGADLKGAYFEGANFEGANFEGANLEGAYFRDADLRGAIFDKGVVKETRYFEMSYKYSSMLIITDGELYIKMGCFLRTESEWRTDFWNNPKEFSKGSEEGEKRLAAMNMMLRSVGKDEIEG